MKKGGKTHHFCNKCQCEKTIDNFYKASWCRGGYRPTCNDCREEQILMRNYGVTKEWFLEKSKNGCELCGRTRQIRNRLKGSKKEYRLSVDHDHKTGKTRGVLCNNCNRNIGIFFDDEDMFNRVLKYLERGK